MTFESESVLKEIGDFAFSGTGLGVLELPARCERVSGLSLVGVKRVNVCEDNEFLMAEGGFVKSCDMNRLIRWNCSDRCTVVVRGTETISDGCFYRCRSLCEIRFESDSRLKRIGKCAFERACVSKIEIPWSVEEIGENCFRLCISLCEIRFESGSMLKRIGECAFECTSVSEIEIPSSVGKYAFGCRSVRETEICSTAEEIGNDYFSGCGGECAKDYSEEKMFESEGRRERRKEGEE
jgi:hypothetical protein